MTFWQLCCLAEGHGRDRWARSSLLCALIVNAHRDPKKGRAAKPEDFSPFGREDDGEAIRVTEETIGEFKEAFTQLKGTV